MDNTVKIIIAIVAVIQLVNCADNSTESIIRHPTVTVSQSAGNSNSVRHNFKCPEQFGYYPDDGDCSKYFVCVFGDPLHETCTGGLYFSSLLQTCDWPRNVDCFMDDDNKKFNDHFNSSAHDVIPKNRDRDDDDTDDSDILYDDDDIENEDNNEHKNNRDVKLSSQRVVPKNGPKDTIVDDDGVNDNYNNGHPKSESPTYRDDNNKRSLPRSHSTVNPSLDIRSRSRHTSLAPIRPNRPITSNQLDANAGLIGRSVSGSGVRHGHTRAQSIETFTTPYTIADPSMSERNRQDPNDNKVNVELDLKQPQFDEAVNPIIDEDGGIHVHDGPGGTYSLPEKSSNSVNSYAGNNGNENADDKDPDTDERIRSQIQNSYHNNGEEVIENNNNNDNYPHYNDDDPKNSVPNSKRQYIPVIIMSKEDILPNNKQDNEQLMVRRYLRSNNGNVNHLRNFSPLPYFQNQRIQQQNHFRQSTSASDSGTNSSPGSEPASNSQPGPGLVLESGLNVNGQEFRGPLTSTLSTESRIKDNGNSNDPQNVEFRGYVTTRNDGGRIIAIPIYKDNNNGAGSNGNRRKRVRIVSRIIPRFPSSEDLKLTQKPPPHDINHNFFTESPPIRRSPTSSPSNFSPLPRIYIPNIKRWFPNLPFYGPSLTQISRVKILPPIGPLPSEDDYPHPTTDNNAMILEERHETLTIESDPTSADINRNLRNDNGNDNHRSDDNWNRHDESHVTTIPLPLPVLNIEKPPQIDDPQNFNSNYKEEKARDQPSGDDNTRPVIVKPENVNPKPSRNRSRSRNRKRIKVTSPKVLPQTTINTSPPLPVTIPPPIVTYDNNRQNTDVHNNQPQPDSINSPQGRVIPPPNEQQSPRRRYKLQKGGRRLEPDSVTSAPLSRNSSPSIVRDKSRSHEPAVITNTGAPPSVAKVNNYDYPDYPFIDDNGHYNNLSLNNLQTTVTLPLPTEVTEKPTEKPRVSKKKSHKRFNISSSPATRFEPIYPTPDPFSPATKCIASKCLLPDCFCGGTVIPGDLKSSQVPQMVLITFDDSVNDLNWEIYEEIFTDRKSPNGCPIRGTFYVSHEWTDYGQVQTLYSRGHEMASHSITHSFGEKFSKTKWHKEIHGQREILHLYGGVHMADVRGMRAPFLQGGGNKQFEMLYDANFTYDSTMPVFENSPPFWPYTLDYAINHECMIAPCPSRSFPGVWEVGMVMWKDLRGGRCSMGDACSNPSDEDGVYEMLMKNFNRHYESNRAPFGLYYHSAWFNTVHHRRGFMRFIDEILTLNDVYFITKWQLIQWMRSPTSLDTIKDFKPWECNYDNRPPPCDHPTVCNVGSKSGSRFFKTCQSCPSAYPWVGNTGINSKT